LSTDADDVALWLSFKKMAEVMRGRVLDDVIAHSPLSEPELTVLVLLDDAGGVLRQNALVVGSGWDRTRMSHLLTRMEERGYLSRERLRNGVEVTMRDPGRAVFESTRVPLGNAVRKHITSRLDDGQRAAMRSVIAALAD